MSPKVRAWIAGASGAGLLLLIVAGFSLLPHFGTYLGPYGTVLNARAPTERKIENVITAVNFDYRALDTMGEEFILFAAVCGLTLVLRKDRAETTGTALEPASGRPAGTRSDALELFAVCAIGLTVAFGCYMAVHPHLTPGGGFQGGAITAGFAALIFLGLGYRPFKRIVEHRRSELLESLGAAGYVVIGLAALVAGGAFLANVLPLGAAGTFFSTGTIPLINACVALEVVSGFVVMFGEFADETRVERP